MKVSTFFSVVIALTISSFAYASDYPSRPIRLIVASAASGATDFVARVFGPSVSDTLGESIPFRTKRRRTDRIR